MLNHLDCLKTFSNYFQLRQTSLEQVRIWLSGQSHLKRCCRPGLALRLDQPGFDSDNFLLRLNKVFFFLRLLLLIGHEVLLDRANRGV
jgi:hypothetical protein